MNLFDFAAQEARKYGLDPELVQRQMRAESGGNTAAVSPKGARGPMQLIPATAASLGVDIDDPLDNIRGGVRYLAQQMRDFGSPELALAAYNAGPGNVRKYGGVPPFSETRNYVGKIMGGRSIPQDDSDIFGTPAAVGRASARQQDAVVLKADLRGGPATARDDDSDIFGTPPAPSQAVKPASSTESSGNRPAAQQIPSGFVRGLRDPIDAGAQLLTNILPSSTVRAGNRLNNWLAENTGIVGRLPAGGIDQQVRESEQSYQGARQSSGEGGIDWPRMAGNLISPANLAIASRFPVASTLVGKAVVGAIGGAVSGAMTPVGEGDFASAKMRQAGAGALLGGMIPAVGNGIARLVNPKAATNAQLQGLRSEGVNPTIGQSLGGMMNRIEEKSQSVPILGDAIMAARARARDDFNRAAINRAAGKVGAQVDDIGHPGVRSAGNAISDFYDAAISKVNAVPLDKTFDAELSQLQGMAQNMTPDMARKFSKTLNDVVMSRVSPNGHILGRTYKTIDSDLGTLASRYGKSSQASEQEFGDAVLQLKNLLNQQMRRTNPNVDAMLNKADAAWANIVRVEGAAKAAKNAEGVFTPAQLNTAIQTADKSVRGRAVARGTALMQDLANAGQNVLGNRYPDSGTAGRLMLGAGGLGAGFLNPAIPVGLLGASALYTAPAQKALTAMVSRRPKEAGLLADLIQQGMPYLLPASGQIAAGLLE